MGGVRRQSAAAATVTLAVVVRFFRTTTTTTTNEQTNERLLFVCGLPAYLLLRRTSLLPTFVVVQLCRVCMYDVWCMSYLVWRAAKTQTQAGSENNPRRRLGCCWRRQALCPARKYPPLWKRSTGNEQRNSTNATGSPKQPPRPVIPVLWIL